MTLDKAIAILRAHEAELRGRGVRRAAIFGSVARGDAGRESDVDILVELDPDRRLDVFAYVGLKRYIAGLFAGEVDVINRATLKPHLRAPTGRDAVYAF
jgi:predicted nucleotidyltransferase